MASTATLGLLLRLLLLLLGASPPCSAQFPRLQNANLTQISSPIDPSIKITFKEPQGACTTAFPSQQQYTGWVNVPDAYQTNIFFWFVAAREPTSLLTIWLNGGPGSSSMFGLFAETGPCEVIEQGAPTGSARRPENGAGTGRPTCSSSTRWVALSLLRRSLCITRHRRACVGKQAADVVAGSQTKSASRTTCPPTARWISPARPSRSRRIPPPATAACCSTAPSARRASTRRPTRPRSLPWPYTT